MAWNQCKLTLLVCMQIMELDQKLQEATREASKLQAADSDLQERLRRERQTAEVTDWFQPAAMRLKSILFCH